MLACYSIDKTLSFAWICNRNKAWPGQATNNASEHVSHPSSLAEPENEIFLLVFGHP